MSGARGAARMPRGRGMACALMAAMLGGCAVTHGQGAVEAGYGLLILANDRDGDGMLDRDEVAAMVDAAVPPERRGAGWPRLRGWLVDRFLEQDRDGDGRLALGEMVRGPVAGFQCLDRDGDGRVEGGEAAAGWGMCLAENL